MKPQARIGQVVPSASRRTNDFLGWWIVLAMLAILAIVIAILIVLLVRTSTTTTEPLLTPDPLCDDSNVCTVDLCDGHGGCVHRPLKNNGTACNDVCYGPPVITRRGQKHINRMGKSAALVPKDARVVLDNGVCRDGSCVASSPCLGSCDEGHLCPVIAFKSPSACSTICTSTDGQCQYHCLLQTVAPWYTGDEPKQQAFEDNRMKELCRQELDLTDSLTSTLAHCLVESWQLRKEEIILKNVVQPWVLVCQWHFACGGTNTMSPLPYILSK